MPYAIATLFACDDAECSPRCRNRKVVHSGVATLGDAQEVVNNAYSDWAERTGQTISFPRALPESGGSVGPLPDGSVIEVERVSYDDLRHRSGLPLARNSYTAQAILDAFNGTTLAFPNGEEGR